MSDPRASIRKPWQFSLPRLLVAATVLAAVLGIVKLLGLDMVGGWWQQPR
jgi:negative regulator of sigma E activity